MDQSILGNGRMVNLGMEQVTTKTEISKRSMWMVNI